MEEGDNKFASMLTEAILSIKAIEHLRMGVREVEEMLGKAIGKSQSTVNKWRYEGIPRAEDLAQLARTIRTHLDKDRAWFAEFLKAGEYEEWEELLDELFPPLSGASDGSNVQQDVAPSPALEPAVGVAEPAARAPSEKAEAATTALNAAPWKKWSTIGMAVLVVTLLLMSMATRTLSDISAGTSTISPIIVETPSDGALIKDGGFEGNTPLTEWQFSGNCEPQVVKDAVSSYEGAQYLAVTDTEDCVSFYQDLTLPPNQGNRYTLSAWVRSPGATYPALDLTVKPLRDSGGRDGPRVGPDKASAEFKVFGTEWQCVETRFTVRDASTTGVRVEINLKEQDNTKFLFDRVRIMPGDSLDCPPRAELRLFNASFEERADSIKPWQYEDGCTVSVGDGTSAHDGQRYIEVARELWTCASVYQDLLLNPEPGENYRFKIWVRAPDAPRSGHVALWAIGGTDREYSKHSFHVEGPDWHCVEVDLPIHLANHSSLRAEVYLDMADGLPYNFDNAVISTDSAEGCPTLPLVIDNLSIETQAPHYVGAGVGVTAEVVSKGEIQDKTSKLRFWLSESADGSPINSSLIVEQVLPTLEPETRHVSDESYVLIPVGLEEGIYHVVAEAVATGHRMSEPIAVSPCFGQTIFCDVDTDMWAHQQIEQWAENNFMSGCQANTTIYNNRPFCTGQVVPRFALAVVLVQMFEGGGFKPILPPHDYYADVSGESNYVSFIEYLYERGITLPSESCPPTAEGKPNFCPDLLVSRAELAGYMAEIFEWPLDDVAIMDELVDLPDDPQSRRAISYMLQNGIFSLSAPGCPASPEGPRFCPDAPIRRASLAYVMGRILDGGHESLFVARTPTP